MSEPTMTQERIDALERGYRYSDEFLEASDLSGAHIPRSTFCALITAARRANELEDEINKILATCGMHLGSTTPARDIPGLLDFWAQGPGGQSHMKLEAEKMLLEGEVAELRDIAEAYWCECDSYGGDEQCLHCAITALAKKPTDALGIVDRKQLRCKIESEKGDANAEATE